MLGSGGRGWGVVEEGMVAAGIQTDRQTDRDREVLCKVSPLRGIFDASLF